MVNVGEYSSTQTTRRVSNKRWFKSRDCTRSRWSSKSKSIDYFIIVSEFFMRIGFSKDWFRQISLGIIAICMIALLGFIQFGLPHEDHMTKQYVNIKNKQFFDYRNCLVSQLRYQRWMVDHYSWMIFLRIVNEFMSVKDPNLSNHWMVYLRIFLLLIPLNFNLGLLYTGLKNGSIVELDPVTRRTRIIYSSLSVDDHQLSCGK